MILGTLVRLMTVALVVVGHEMAKEGREALALAGHRALAGAPVRPVRERRMISR